MDISLVLNENNSFSLLNKSVVFSDSRSWISRNDRYKTVSNCAFEKLQFVTEYLQRNEYS